MTEDTREACEWLGCKSCDPFADSFDKAASTLFLGAFPGLSDQASNAIVSAKGKLFSYRLGA